MTNVVYVEAPGDLATVGDLSAHLLQELGESREPQAIESLRIAQSVVRSYCRGWLLSPGRSTVTLPFPPANGMRASSTQLLALNRRAWSARVRLPQSPVFDIHAVTVDDAASEWMLDEADNLVLPQTAASTVVVDYSHGYALDAPELSAAKLVTLRLAARLLTNPMQRASYSNQDYNYSGVSDTPARLLTGDERLMLDPIRGVVI